MPIKSKVHNKKRPKRKINILKYLFLILGLILVLIAGYIIFTPAKFWDGKSRVALATSTEEGSIKIIVFDPQTKSINTLIVPATTELDVARQLGSWKAQSIYKLGVNEKVGGVLISETVTRSLRLPTESWAEEKALGFTNSNSFVVWKTIFSSFKTNLNIKDKLGIGLFAMGINNTERAEIDLSQTPLLLKTKLNDGTIGYKVRESNVARISAIFGDGAVSEENINLAIFYPADRIGVGEKLGEVIQVLGAKVTSLESSDNLKIDCEVIGRKSQTRKKIANVFNCQTKDNNQNDNIEIHIGEAFIKRF